MASWVIHLRVADTLLKSFPQLSCREFVCGNIAPDSGVPAPGDYIFSPPKKVSHFLCRDGSHNLSGYKEYYEKYLPDAKISGYDIKALSFHLGYFCHLITDWHWSTEIAIPLVNLDPDAYEKDKVGVSAPWKKDWYGLDLRYLLKNPDFMPYKILKDKSPFKNVYLDFFPEDAFELLRDKIVKFYSRLSDDPNREYKYISEERADRFILDVSRSAKPYLDGVLGSI